MKKKQRFYLMIESDKEVDPKEILFALSEARPNWGGMSASLAAQQSPDACPVCFGEKGAFVDGHWSDCIHCLATGKRQ